MFYKKSVPEGRRSVSLRDIDFECVNGDMPQHGSMDVGWLKTAGIPDSIGEVVGRPHFLTRFAVTVLRNNRVF